MVLAYVCSLRTSSNENCLFTIHKGAPSGLDATLDSVISGGKMQFSLAVTDRSQAPARNILVYLEVSNY